MKLSDMAKKLGAKFGVRSTSGHSGVDDAFAEMTNQISTPEYKPVNTLPLNQIFKEFQNENMESLKLTGDTAKLSDLSNTNEKTWVIIAFKASHTGVGRNPSMQKDFENQTQRFEQISTQLSGADAPELITSICNAPSQIGVGGKYVDRQHKILAAKPNVSLSEYAKSEFGDTFNWVNRQSNAILYSAVEVKGSMQEVTQAIQNGKALEITQMQTYGGLNNALSLKENVEIGNQPTRPHM